ncbi:MAG: hypothetical protein IT374_06910 [Polyangiaceae bacterium]|nr:hypothetical protein [Polyangiaceae bacterium]
MAMVATDALAAPTSEATPSVLPVGLTAGGFAVVHAARSRGALRVSMSAPDGDSYVAIVCAHDGARPAVATSGSLDVFVENQGQGDTPTNERHGLSAMALVTVLGPSEAELAGLSTLTERHASPELTQAQ